MHTHRNGISTDRTVPIQYYTCRLASTRCLFPTVGLPFPVQTPKNHNHRRVTLSGIYRWWSVCCSAPLLLQTHCSLDFRWGVANAQVARVPTPLPRILPCRRPLPPRLTYASEFSDKLHSLVTRFAASKYERVVVRQILLTSVSHHGTQQQQQQQWQQPSPCWGALCTDALEWVVF